MMAWKQCVLTAQQITEGALIQITNNFAAVTMSGTAPFNAILFCRDAIDGMVFFASPPSTDVIEDPALAKYDWTSCAMPQQDGLMLLAGHGDPVTLFEPA